MKNILYTQTALDIRILLLNIFVSKEYDEKTLHETILKINKYFETYEEYGQIRPGQGYWHTYNNIQIQYVPKKVKPKDFYKKKNHKIKGK